MGEKAIPVKWSGSGVDAVPGATTGSIAGRRDGRTPGEMRSILTSQGVLTRADGSARVKLCNTDVIVAVYGPLDCPVHKQNAEAVHIHVAYRRGEGSIYSSAQDSALANEATATRDLRTLVKKVVLATLHPRKAVVVAVQVLADDGGVMSAVVNAAVMALIDAGVSMRLVPTAATVSILNGIVFVDPSRVEEGESTAVITAVFDVNLVEEKGFLSVFTDGDCGGDELFTAAVDTCRQLASKTKAFMKLSIEQKANRQYIWGAS